MRPDVAARLALLALALAAGGCADDALCVALGGVCGDDVRPAAPPEPTRCRLDADCAPNGLGEVCRTADGTGAPSVAPTDGGTASGPDGICVIPSRPDAKEIYLEVRPLSGEALPLTQYGPVDTSLGQNQEIRLAPPVTVSGKVRARGTSDGIASAKVRFRARSIIPGHTLSFEVTAADGARQGLYSRVLPQAAYSVTVIPPPRGGILPPPERPFGDSLTEELVGEHVLDLDVTPSADLIAVSGRASFTNEAGDRLPAASVDVWALEATDTPRPRTLSQASRTDADGRFTLWLPALPTGVEAWEFRLQFTPSPSLEGFPTFTLSRAWKASATRELDEIVIGKVPGLVEVSGTVFDASGSGASERKPVGQARVVFRAESGGAYSFTASTFSGADGRYRLRLLKGNYNAIAIPPVDRADTGIVPLAPCPFGGKLSPENGVVVNFACERRKLLGGQLHKPGMVERAEGVAIEAVRRPDEELAEELFEQTVSDADGNFALALAPGTYDITLKPPPDAKLPFKVLPPIRFDGPKTIAVEFEPPFELFGRLLAGSPPEPIEATIEAYEIKRDGDSAVSEPIGRGVAQAGGAYSIVLPGQR